MPWNETEDDLSEEAMQESNLVNGRCEDFPCCGHEAGDCDGSLYGSDEAIKQRVYDRMDDDIDMLDDPEGEW